MNDLPSIRQRLSQALVGISIAWGLAVSVVVWFAVHHEVGELLDSTLQESAEIIYGLLSFNAAQLPLNGGGALPAPVHDEQLVWQIVGADQRVLLRSHRAPDLALVDQPTQGLASVSDAWRVYGMPFDASGRRLYVAQRAKAREQTRLEAAFVTCGSALVVGAMCALWLRSRASKELQPVAEMSDAVTRYDPLHGHAHLAKPRRSELVAMHHAITDLGTRLARQLSNERAFSAHAAHALRTPLAGMVAQLAVAQRELPPEAQPRLQRTREAADRLRRVVTALLTLFRTGTELSWQSVDVNELVRNLHFEKLRLVSSEALFIEADPDLLAAALLNLLDNSVKHGAQTVMLSGYVDSKSSCLYIHDDGAGMPAARLAQIQAALKEQRYEGEMGLGLMLADLVARAHGGSLRLHASSSGCKMELCFARRPL
jgi:signal transduction histidine kinase